MRYLAYLLFLDMNIIFNKYQESKQTQIRAENHTSPQSPNLPRTFYTVSEALLHSPRNPGLVYGATRIYPLSLNLSNNATGK